MGRKLRELTIKDDFMFGAVMSDPENCRELLEMILGISIDRIEVQTFPFVSGSATSSKFPV